MFCSLPLVLVKSGSHFLTAVFFYAFFSFISKNSHFSEDRISSVFLNTVRIKAIPSCNLQLNRLLFFITNPFFQLLLFL